jgi:YggT family protein
MGNAYVADAGTFLIGVVFGFFVLATLLRLLLTWVRADFYNPVSQFTVKLTQWAVRPMRRLIPPVGKLDTATLVLLFLAQMIELILTKLMLTGSVNPVGLPIWTLAQLLSLTVTVFIVSIIIEVIASWVAPHSYNPFLDIVIRLNAPILGLARRLVPPISGIDLAPFIATIALILFVKLIVNPLLVVGQGLS